MRGLNRHAGPSGAQVAEGGSRNATERAYRPGAPRAEEKLRPARVNGLVGLDGTLRIFLDRQSMFGMIAVVLVLNIVGFAFIYMLSMVWKSVKHDLLHRSDP